MQFLSFEWVAWLAGTVAGYWILPQSLRERFLILVTLAFLLLHDPLSTVILAAFSVTVYYATRRHPFSGYRIIVVGGLIVAVVAFFKVRLSAAPMEIMRDVAIPLGLSYYSFRCLHYVFERYKGTCQPRNFEEFLAYLFFIPTMVVGPINRAGAFFDDHRGKRWDAAMLSDGIERILYGYVKMAVLGNYLVSSQLGQFIGGLDQQQVALVWYLEIVRGGLNLYFQFSGFSDVAIGFALLLGYRVMENFDWPYLSRNIAEFWRRWHISLTSWSRDYVYMPLLGITRHPYVATVASFAIIGLWHEVSLRYLLWGMYQAAGVFAWQYFQRLKRKLRLPRVRNRYGRWVLDALSILLTVHFVWFSFILVRQPDLISALKIYREVLLFWM